MLSLFKHPITAATLLLFILTLTLQATNAQLGYTCDENVPDFPVDIEKLAGMWYEAARIPDVDVPACVKAIAPSNLTSDGNYALKINFMNNSNKKWQNTTEILNFPWTEEASKGIFQLHYGSGLNTLTFIYKIMATDYDNIVGICSYASIATRVSFFKVFTRERIISNEVKKQVDALLGQYTTEIGIHWVEQSARCSAARVLPYLSIILAVFLVLLLRK